MTNDLTQTNRDLVIAILRGGIRLNEELNLFVKGFGLSLPQFNVLRILRGQKDKPANLFTINEHMIHKMSNTTRLVDKLIDKGFVKRNVCKNNRRKIELIITDNGKNLLASIDQHLDQKEAQLLVQLNTNEKEKLHALISKLI
ncbi:MAG: MarR family winged helix-turn-helix transcriptional regulator [Flavobacteriaceae bacterium]